MIYLSDILICFKLIISCTYPKRKSIDVFAEIVPKTLSKNYLISATVSQLWEQRVLLFSLAMCRPRNIFGQVKLVSQLTRRTLACNLIASDRHLMQCISICICISASLGSLHLPGTSVQSVKASTGVRPVLWFCPAPTFLLSYFRLAAARCTDIGCLVGKAAYLWRGHVMNTPKRHFSSSHPA